MIVEVENGEYGIERAATLQELSEFLNELLVEHPEYKDKSVSVAAECGYSAASIASPVTFAVAGDHFSTCLVSNDDGQYNEKDGWRFYRKEK